MLKKLGISECSAIYGTSTPFYPTQHSENTAEVGMERTWGPEDRRTVKGWPLDTTWMLYELTAAVFI